MILAAGARITNENAEKIWSAFQDLPDLCAALCMAQEMGEDLEWGAVLFGQVPKVATAGRWGHRRWWGRLRGWRAGRRPRSNVP